MAPETAERLRRSQDCPGKICLPRQIGAPTLPKTLLLVQIPTSRLRRAASSTQCPPLEATFPQESMPALLGYTQARAIRGYFIYFLLVVYNYSGMKLYLGCDASLCMPPFIFLFQGYYFTNRSRVGAGTVLVDAAVWHFSAWAASLLDWKALIPVASSGWRRDVWAGQAQQHIRRCAGQRGHCSY